MNRILFQKQESTYALDPKDPRFEHVRGVLRMQPGDSFEVGVVNGPAGVAEVKALDESALEISVTWGERPPLPPPVYLLIGSCRPATARKILTTVPTLGVRGIYICGTGRSDPAYAKSGLWTSGEWRQRLIEGAEQAFDTYVPDLRLCRSLSEGCDLIAPLNCLSLALDVYEGKRPLSAVSVKPDQPVCLAIGPERGWNVNDRRELLGAGFELVGLNERVLRVETAVTVGLTLLLQKLGVY